MDLHREVLPTRKKRNHEKVLMFVFAILAIAGVAVGTVSVVQLRAAQDDVEQMKERCAEPEMPPIGDTSGKLKIKGRWTF